MRLLLDYDWPGNVRELENLMKRAVVLGTDAPINKEITHSLAMAAQRMVVVAPLHSPVFSPQPSVNGRQPANNHQPAIDNRQQPVADRLPPSNGHATLASGATVHTSGPAAMPTPAEIAAAAAAAGNYSLKNISREAARQAERELISRMLQQTRWNRKETAEILGISYKALLYKIRENGLDKAS
jgi:DNA-binding NtrC family response regulator